MFSKCYLVTECYNTCLDAPGGGPPSLRLHKLPLRLAVLAMAGSLSEGHRGAGVGLHRALNNAALLVTLPLRPCLNAA
jgi:hypothetical protein